MNSLSRHTSLTLWNQRYTQRAGAGSRLYIVVVSYPPEGPNFAEPFESIAMTRSPHRRERPACPDDSASEKHDHNVEGVQDSISTCSHVSILDFHQLSAGQHEDSLWSSTVTNSVYRPFPTEGMISLASLNIVTPITITRTGLSMTMTLKSAQAGQSGERLEQFKQHYSLWRSGRKRGAHVTDILWASIVELVGRYRLAPGP
jgi:hypothetical protein